MQSFPYIICIYFFPHCMINYQLDTLDLCFTKLRIIGQWATWLYYALAIESSYNIQQMYIFSWCREFNFKCRLLQKQFVVWVGSFLYIYFQFINKYNQTTNVYKISVTFYWCWIGCAVHLNNLKLFSNAIPCYKSSKPFTPNTSKCNSYEQYNR